MDPAWEQPPPRQYKDSPSKPPDPQEWKHKRNDKLASGGLLLVFGGLAASQPEGAQGTLLLVALFGACRLVKWFFQKDPPAKR